MKREEEKMSEKAEAPARLADAPTAKAISDKIDDCVIRFKTPVGPKGQHDANIHADGWNDGIEAVQRAIEPNLRALEVEAATESDSMKELRAFVSEREAFGIRTDIENRPDPEEGTKGNARGEAYGSGYAECARNILEEIDRKLALIDKTEKQAK